VGKDGFITLSRRLLRHCYWGEKREFSKAEAWIDLIFEAAHSKHMVSICGEEVLLEVGEVPHSLRVLSGRWGWTLGKTKRFIDCAIDRGEVARIPKHQTKREPKHQTKHQLTILSVVNYRTYQKWRSATETPNETRTETPNETNRSKGFRKKERNTTVEIEKVIDAYRKIKATDQTRSRGKKNIAKLLKKHTAKDLIKSIENYLKDIGSNGGYDEKYIKGVGNYFGPRDEVYLEYLPQNYKPQSNQIDESFEELERMVQEAMKEEFIDYDSVIRNIG